MVLLPFHENPVRFIEIQVVHLEPAAIQIRGLIVTGRRTYVGGVIAPGLEAMTNFLYERTALLPRISLKEPRHAVGKSTIEAMLSGAVFGFRGLVKEILARIKAEQFPRKKAYIVATGGYARLIAGCLPEIGVIHPHLTLEGLRIVANLND